MVGSELRRVLVRTDGARTACLWSFADHVGQSGKVSEMGLALEAVLKVRIGHLCMMLLSKCLIVAGIPWEWGQWQGGGSGGQA